MVIMGDFYSWLLWEISIHGYYGRFLFMVIMGDFYSWLLWEISIHGYYGRFQSSLLNVPYLNCCANVETTNSG
jgi:hypothetical protein